MNYNDTTTCLKMIHIDKKMLPSDFKELEK